MGLIYSTWGEAVQRLTELEWHMGGPISCSTTRGGVSMVALDTVSYKEITPELEDKSKRAKHVCPEEEICWRCGETGPFKQQ